MFTDFLKTLSFFVISITVFVLVMGLFSYLWLSVGFDLFGGSWADEEKGTGYLFGMIMTLVNELVLISAVFTFLNRR